jgi:hypothetical protein
MPAKTVAGGTDESEQSASNTDAQDKPTTLLSQLLTEAAADGHTIGPPQLPVKSETSEPEEETEEQGEPEIQEEPQIEEADEEPDEEQEAEEKQPVVQGKKSIEEQLKEYAAKGEKAPWYLSRIADETRKRHKINDVAQGLYTENQRLKQQLDQATAQATAPRPNGKDPLADIFDGAGLKRMNEMYKAVIRMAELNPDGAYDVSFKGADGKETKRDFTREQLVDMKLEAEEGLRTLIPQRAKYLEDRLAKDNEARKFIQS